MTLPKNFKSIIWEYDISKLDIESSLVTERVLNLGDKKITDFWIKKIGKEKAKKLFIKNAKLLDKKSYNYWKIIFGIEKNIDGKKIISDNRTMYEKLNTPVFSRSFG